MTQNSSDVEIANQGFAAFRQDLNNILEDITTLHSGDDAPSTTYANQWWYETDADKLYIRNEDNDAWIEILTFDQANDHLATIGATFTLDGSGNASINGTLDVNGNELILDADGDTSITSDTDDQIDFRTAGTDQMVINSTGDVGIGNTSPESLANYYFLDVGSSSTKRGVVQAYDGTTKASVWTTNSGVARFGSRTDHPVSLEVNGSEKWRVTSSGHLKAFANGYGIDFSASEGSGASSSVLHDYEEGTFTPTLDNVSGVSYGDRTGRYTKIGRAVHYYIRIFTTTMPSDTDDVTISGLPYTVGSSYSQPLGNVSGYRMASNHTTAWAYPASSGTVIYIFAENMLTNTQAITALTYSSFTASTGTNKNIVVVNGTYFTD